MMPKAKGDPYFISCRQGAEEAARSSGVDLIWDGPTDLDPAKQNEVVEAWITRGVDVIAVSVENQAGISTVLRKARETGIKVLTWDADAEPDARDFLVNQATPQGIGETLTDEAARLWAARASSRSSRSLSAANQNEWIEHIKARLAEKYPELHLVAIRPSDGDRDRAFAETQTILKVYPNVKLIMGIAAPAVPGAAEPSRSRAARTSSSPASRCPTCASRTCTTASSSSVVLWNTRDLGYLTVRAAARSQAAAVDAASRRSRPAASARSRSPAIRSCSAGRSSSPRKHRPVRFLGSVVRGMAQHRHRRVVGPWRPFWQRPAPARDRGAQTTLTTVAPLLRSAGGAGRRRATASSKPALVRRPQPVAAQGRPSRAPSSST